jgi:hypothetical protein
MSKTFIGAVVVGNAIAACAGHVAGRNPQRDRRRFPRRLRARRSRPDCLGAAGTPHAVGPCLALLHSAAARCEMGEKACIVCGRRFRAKTNAATCSAKCRRARVQTWKRNYYEANRERIGARQREYNDAHREQRRAYQRAYNKAHREQLNAYQREYRKRGSTPQDQG